MAPALPPSDRGSLTPAAKLLSDPATRLVLEAIGDARGRPQTTASLMENAAPRGFNARLTRDRLRQLQRENLAVPSASGAGQSATTTRWTLTPTGRELQRTLAIVTRVLGNAATRAPAIPDRPSTVLDVAFHSLADPATARVLTILGEHPGEVSPSVLEHAAAPVSRRTMYRRLADLGDAGIALHITHRTVPRTSSWEMSPGWRSAASVPMLLAWWDWRRSGIPDSAAAQVRALVATILPTVHTRPEQSGTVEWTFVGPTRTATLGIEVAGRAARQQPSAHPTATASGEAITWLEALVAGRREGISTVGDTELSASTLNAVRAALFTDVR